MGALLVGQKRLIHLFPVTDADLPDRIIRVEELQQRLCLGLNRAGRRLLDQNIPVLSVFKRKEHEINGLVQRHDKARHRRLGHGQRLSGLDLLDPKGNDAPAGAHHVSVARAADFHAAAAPALCHHDLLHHRLAGAHCVDRIGSLVGGKADCCLHAGVNGLAENVVGAQDVGPDRLQWEKLAGRHLLKGGGMEDKVNAVHRVPDRIPVPDVADIELDFSGVLRIALLEGVAHIVLLLLVAGENTDLADVGFQKAVQYRVAKGAGTAGDQQGLPGKGAHAVHLTSE